MENPDVLHLKVGNKAEMKSFLEGYRGAWFRCKINSVDLKKNKVKLEYYDFPEEEITWEKIYEYPPHVKKLNHSKRQLMVRPEYPIMYHKSAMPPVNSISKTSVVNDGTWKVGDLVDWNEDDCYWSAKVIKVLSDDMVQIELPLPPAGQGGIHEALCKALRPSLDWSSANGWTLPTLEGETSCCAQLIFPSKQGTESEEEENEEEIEKEEVENDAAAAAGGGVGGGGGGGSPLNAASSTSGIYLNSLAADEGDTERHKTSEQQTPAAAATAAVVDKLISQESQQSEKEDVKMDEIVTEKTSSSSDSISTLHVQPGDDTDNHNDKNNNNSSSIQLNIMHEETLEAAILDLEELVNKIKWIKNILHSNTNQSPTTSSWEFA